MNEPMPVWLGIVIVLGVLAVFLYGVWCIFAAVDGEADSKRDAWTNDVHPWPVRWVYLWGRANYQRTRRRRARASERNRLIREKRHPS